MTNAIAVAGALCGAFILGFALVEGAPLGCAIRLAVSAGGFAVAIGLAVAGLMGAVRALFTLMSPLTVATISWRVGGDP